jgi:hypothetical protein
LKTQFPAANDPVNAAGVLNALAVVPVRNEFGFAVVELSEKAVVACFVPASNSAVFAAAILPTVQPSVRLAAAW